MKRNIWISLLVMCGLLLGLAGSAGAQTPLGTAFTYQGRLSQGGNPVTDTCDFQFSLYDAVSAVTQIGATQAKNSVSVSNGLFTVELDFGPGVFQGDARWLEVAVRCPAGSGSYTPLTPRQELTPAPYALALPGLWTQPHATSPNLIGGYNGNWVADGVVGATIGGGGTSGDPPQINRVTDAFGTVSGGADNLAGDYAGTTTDASYATVGGGAGNTVSDWYATVGGGSGNTASGLSAVVGGGAGNTAAGQFTAVGGGTGNSASLSYDTVSGGIGNTASGGSVTIGGGEYISVTGQAATVAGGSTITVTGGYGAVGGGRHNLVTGDNATVGGGGYNTASGWLYGYATVGGGRANTASGGYATVGGGDDNTAGGKHATVGGGINNTVWGRYATVAGGSDNVITDTASYATIPGGVGNFAQGSYSFAAGRRAQAMHDGAFVWADSTDAPFASATHDEFRVRATGGGAFLADNDYYGLIVNNTGTGSGIAAYASSSRGNTYGAVYAVNTGTSPGVYASSLGTYAGYFVGNIFVNGSCTGCSLVYIGLNDGSEPLETGDLVAVSGVSGPLAGTVVPVMRVRRADAGNANAVIGVVRSKAEIIKSSRGGEVLESANLSEGPAASGDYVFIVVQGITQVKVDGAASSIEPGQRLTAADLPGHARALRSKLLDGMVVTEGAPVIGIALAALEEDSDTIPVFVTLR